MVAVGPAVGLLACWACKNKKIKNKEEEEEKIKLKSSGQKIATEEEENRSCQSTRQQNSLELRCQHGPGDEASERSNSDVERSGGT